MPITIQIKGMERIQNLFRNLPKTMQQEIGKNQEGFLKAVRKSAKLRAPKDTRELKESIKVRKRKKNEWILEVTAPYAIFQEYGFRPPWIHTSMIIGSNKLSQIYGERSRFIYVSRSKPFIRPALEANIAKLPSILSKGAKKAINKARRLK